MTVPNRRFKNEKLYAPTVFRLVTKINKLVSNYAIKRKLVGCLYSTGFDVFDNTKKPSKILGEISILRIDISRDFSNMGKEDIFLNSPFGRPKPLYNVIKDYTQLYYPEYVKIDEFITKLLYNFPSELNENDFEEINNLYKEFYQKDLKSAFEQIQEEEKI